MRLAVFYSDGTPHEVEVTGQAVVGRDPSCDIVLSDHRCSRHHAVLEENPEGSSIRDTDSANGVYVNGRRVGRSQLRPGDTVRLGDTLLQVLPDAKATNTTVPDEARTRDALTPTSSGLERPSAGRTAARSTRRPASAVGPVAPLTVTALSVLWALAAPVFLAAGLVTAARQGRSPVVAALAAGTGLVLAALAGLLAIGLRARAGWARYLQIVAAGLGLLICPFTFASATVLVYLLRPDVRAAFDGTSSGAAEGAGDAELTFALSLFGMLALGLILTAVAVLLRGGP